MSLGNRRRVVVVVWLLIGLLFGLLSNIPVAHSFSTPLNKCLPLPSIVTNQDTLSDIAEAFSRLADKSKIKGKFEGSKSCAIVGNAGVLSKQNFGSSIDKHDVVMRMNHAPTGRRQSSLKSRVGVKSSVRLLNIMWTRRYGTKRLRCEKGRNVCTSGGSPEQGTLMATRVQSGGVNLCTQLKRARPDATCQSVKVVHAASKLLSMFRVSLKNCGKGPHPSYAETTKNSPSTGFLAFYMAALMPNSSAGRGLCQKRVAVYGFAGDAAKSARYKYHSFGRMRGYGSHNFLLEQSLMRKLARNASALGLPPIVFCGSKPDGGCKY